MIYRRDLLTYGVKVSKLTASLVLVYLRSLPKPLQRTGFRLREFLDLSLIARKRSEPRYKIDATAQRRKEKTNLVASLRRCVKSILSSGQGDEECDRR
jgi:predicted DNA-binding ribbon-helix-helix protein